MAPRERPIIDGVRQERAELRRQRDALDAAEVALRDRTTVQDVEFQLRAFDETDTLSIVHLKSGASFGFSFDAAERMAAEIQRLLWV